MQHNTGALVGNCHFFSSQVPLNGCLVDDALGIKNSACGKCHSPGRLQQKEKKAYRGRMRGRARVMGSTEDAAELDSRSLSSFPQWQLIRKPTQGSVAAVINKANYLFSETLRLDWGVFENKPFFYVFLFVQIIHWIYFLHTVTFQK